MHKCPCCAGVLLRHTRAGSIYWFCPHCWEEMPDFAIDHQAKHSCGLPAPEFGKELLSIPDRR